MQVWWSRCGGGAGVVVQVRWCRCDGGGAGVMVQVWWCRCTGAGVMVQLSWPRYNYANVFVISIASQL